MPMNNRLAIEGGIPVRRIMLPYGRQSIDDADIQAVVDVLRGEWLRPGAHVNAVGASLPEARELDTEAVRRARLYVDRRESALHEAGDFLVPRAEGAIADDHIVELQCLSQPMRLFVEAKDLYLYFIGTSGAARR